MLEFNKFNKKETDNAAQDTFQWKTEKETAPREKDEETKLVALPITGLMTVSRFRSRHLL